MRESKQAAVLVLEVEPMTRLGLVHSIDSHPRLTVCGMATSAPAARELCAKWRPELMVMDCLAPGGLGLTKELPRWSPGVRVVCFTRAEDALSVQRVLQAGARGYVTRSDPAESLIETLLAVREGAWKAGPRVAEALLQTLASGGVEVRNTEAALLSNRELEVYKLLGGGCSTRAVAELLHLSVKTVETHRERIKGKLQLASGAELQRRAVLYHESAAERPNGEERVTLNGE